MYVRYPHQTFSLKIWQLPQYIQPGLMDRKAVFGLRPNFHFNLTVKHLCIVAVVQ